MNANELAEKIQFDVEPYIETDQFIFDECANMLLQQQAEIAELKHMNRNWQISERMALAEIEALKDFAIWMTGCGYDFCQHDYFIKCRDELLVGKAQEK